MDLLGHHVFSPSSAPACEKKQPTRKNSVTLHQKNGLVA